MRFISAPGPVKAGKFEFAALFAMSCVVANLARLSPAVVNEAIEGGECATSFIGCVVGVMDGDDWRKLSCVASVTKVTPLSAAAAAGGNVNDNGEVEGWEDE